ncbi:hypothetical protein K440DRAFT_625182 [Wilcoxina mikolae CBS 423.85]|nr:hypothetical protein K440DRAFT_625182 [Wilcoxina mikolae CBS 423.85]
MCTYPDSIGFPEQNQSGKLFKQGNKETFLNSRRSSWWWWWWWYEVPGNLVAPSQKVLRQ